MRELKRIDPFSTAKIAGVIYLIITAVILVPFSLIMMLFVTSNSFKPSVPESIFFGGAFFLFLPIAYAVIGYLATLLSCAVYNLVASWVGGIKYEVEDSI